MEIYIKKLSDQAMLPESMTVGSSGFDVCALIRGLEEETPQGLLIQPGERKLIPTGLSFEIPLGFEIQVRPRSGLASKHGITVLNAPGTIDSDYRGELKVILINLGQKDFYITQGMRIAQLVIQKIEKPTFLLRDTLSDSIRKDGGFGSTGISEPIQSA